MFGVVNSVPPWISDGELEHIFQVFGVLPLGLPYVAADLLHGASMIAMGAQ